MTNPSAEPLSLPTADEVPDPLEQEVRSALCTPPLNDEEVRRAEPLIDALATPGFAVDVSTLVGLPALRLGDCWLERPLSEGGMGLVWLARHRAADGPRVAVKVVHPQRRTTQSDARFRREARIAASLNHPHIVRVLDRGEDAGRLYMVLEMLDGESLRDLLTRLRRLTVPCACTLIRQAAEALAYAHAEGVTHRDVKLSNLFVTREGVVKVLDWGLARRPGEEEVTVPGQILGTNGYLSPEQESDPREAGPSSDVYSLGITLSSLLTGKRPGRETLSGLPSEVPGEMAAFLERMTAAAPQDRPTAAEVALRLADFSTGCDVPALLTAETALCTSLDLLWRDDTAGRLRSLFEEGALPMAWGTQFRVEARLNRPAYLYLMWIDTGGQIGHLSGWEEGTWRPLTGTTTQSSLLLPEYDLRKGWTWIPLVGRSGTETVVLLARRSPLAEDIERWFPEGVRAVFARVLSQMPRDPKRAYEFVCGREAAADGVRGPGQPTAASDDPLGQVQSFLHDCLGPHFDLIRAVSFANAGRGANLV